MRFLFATGEPFVPDVHGGAERSIDELARELLPRGHACEALAAIAPAALSRHRLWRLVTVGRRPARLDRRNAYPTFVARRRDARAALRERLARFRPDLVLSWNRDAEAIAREADAAGVATAVWVPDVTFRWHEGALPAATRLAGASEFVAARIRERLSREASVLRPAIRLESYRVERPAPEAIGLVGPRAEKGVEVALAVAALLPRRRFLFVRAGPSPGDAEVDRRARALGNVAIEPATDDMRGFYARAALLLAPSQVEDASPRVVVEAHASGIPVVASRTGGIPEVAGDAAILLDPRAPAEAWAAAVEDALAPGRREDLAARSLRNAARPELSIAAAADALLALARAPEPAAAKEA